jgi:predicted dehydrogenase
MLVLGTHDFDLMRFFLGDPRWCLANIARDGRDIRGQDVQKGREPVLVAGDTIHALFGFPENIVVHWSSVKATGWKEDGKRERWAFEILGTHGIVAYQAGPGFAWLDSPYLLPADGTARWQPLPEPRQFDWPSSSRHPIRSLIHAIETDAQPLCSAEDGRWTIEMVSAVYASQRSRARVDLPLTDRRHPLTRF